jgi:hypothetical protein
MTTCYLAPNSVQSTFFIPGGNTPANGAKLFFYVSGTSTKQTVYKDNVGGVAHTNPIILDSGGNIPSGGQVWFPSGQTFTCKFCPWTDSDPPVSPYWTKDNLAGMNDVAAQTGNEWITGPTPTFVATTSFTLSGDQTNTFQVGRRVKTTNTGGTVYGTIVADTFASGSTTVYTSNDSGVLDSGLSAVQYGLLSSINISSPRQTDGQFRIAASSDTTKLLALNINQFASSTQRTVSVADRSFTIGKPPSVTTFTVVTTGTYTIPTDSLFIWVRMVGGGGGGGASTTNAGSTGAATTFGNLNAGGGLGGIPTGLGGAGGSASGGDVNVVGARGGAGGAGVFAFFAGGDGGRSYFGGTGTGGASVTNGSSAAAGTGGGGGGGGQSAANTGAGGGSGGYVEKFFSSPVSGVSSYAYAVGAGGAGGGAGGQSGGNGGSGQIAIIEFYS